MPSERVGGGWRWGKKGKIYKRKSDADKQGRAIHASRDKGRAGKSGRNRKRTKKA